MQKKNLLYAQIVLGLVIALYLTAVHFDTNILACPSTGIINCDNVLTSQYSVIFGVPVAVLGLILFVLALVMLPRYNDTMIFLWSIAAVGAVLYSFTTQALIGNICIYCVLLDLVISSTIYVANKKIV